MTLFLAASLKCLVNRTALQGNNGEARTSATYGESLPGLFARLTHDGLWERMCQGYSQATIDGSLDEFSGTWPKWGMMLAGSLMELPTWELRTEGKESLLWRTPQAHNANQGPKSKEFYRRCLETNESMITLTDQVRHNPGKMWPTPMSSDGKHSGPNQRDSSGKLALAGAAYHNATMWPTPHANCHTGAGAQGRECGLNIQTAVKMWPTPNSSDHRDRGNLSDPAIQRRVEIGKQISLSMAMEGDGQLNPSWVECLMNLPIGWTDPDCDEPQPWPGVPAGPGESQHEWEPPRLAKGVPRRRERLQAIGNAVYPAQARPIFRAIMDIEGVRA